MTTEKGVCWLGSDLEKGKEWTKKHMSVEQFVEDNHSEVLVKASKVLMDNTQGTPSTFDGPFDLVGTPFQKKIWAELLKIKAGTTLTYGQLAKELGSPGAARAVGSACRTNPVMILIPCHRVIGSNGKLTGYAGGLDTKEWLLKLEKSQQSLF